MATRASRSWINYWPNFLEGMNHDRHPWKVNNHPDRRDKTNGWGSPLIRFVQESMTPYLLIDHELGAMQPVKNKVFNKDKGIHQTTIFI